VRGHRRLADLTRAAPPSRRRARCAWSWGVHASRSGGHRAGALPGARRSPGQARRPAAHACTLEGPARLPTGYKQRSCMHCRTNWHPAQILARQADERRALAACQAAPLFRARRMGPSKSMRQLPCRQPEAGRIWPAPTATARVALGNWHACGRSNLQYNTDRYSDCRQVLGTGARLPVIGRARGLRGLADVARDALDELVLAEALAVGPAQDVVLAADLFQRRHAHLQRGGRILRGHGPCAQSHAGLLPMSAHMGGP